jgi:hypothetical protein
VAIRDLVAIECLQDRPAISDLPQDILDLWLNLLGFQEIQDEIVLVRGSVAFVEAADTRKLIEEGFVDQVDHLLSVMI